MNQRDDSVHYGHLDVFIRHDLAEIRGLVVVAPSHSQDFPFFFSSTSGVLITDISTSRCVWALSVIKIHS